MRECPIELQNLNLQLAAHTIAKSMLAAVFLSVCLVIAT